jgi:hypothetical protein
MRIIKGKNNQTDTDQNKWIKAIKVIEEEEQKEASTKRKGNG